MTTPFQKKIRRILQDGLRSHLRWLKVMSSPGIVFTDEQQKTVRSLVEKGEMKKAQNIILDEIKRQS